MGSQNGKPVLRQEDLSALSKTSGLEEKNIIGMFNSFIENNPSGSMKKKDFRELMSHALPKKDISKMENHVFRIYDANQDGSVDFHEFMMVFHIMSAGSNEEVLKKIFRVFDVNCDGSVTRKEMNKLINDMYGLLKSGNPDLADKETVARKAFSEMDKNGDGQITEAEFVESCLGQEEISKLLALKIIDIIVDDNDDE